MNTRFLTLLAAAIIIAVLMIFQATKESSAHVLLPSDLIKHGSQSTMNRIRVAGRVTTLPIDYVTEPKIRLSFWIKEPGSNDTFDTEENAVKIIYDGLKPDMFAPGRDVIVDGKFEGGVFYATNLLTQCPSKYEPPDLSDPIK